MSGLLGVASGGGVLADDQSTLSSRWKIRLKQTRLAQWYSIHAELTPVDDFERERLRPAACLEALRQALQPHGHGEDLLLRATSCGAKTGEALDVPEADLLLE